MAPANDDFAICPRAGAAFLDSVSRTALVALSVGLALGVVLPGEAQAGPGIVNPVQASTYYLGRYNPTLLGPGTNINAVLPFATGVYGDSSAAWSVINQGAVQGALYGVNLTSPGASVSNAGAIGSTSLFHSYGVALQGTVDNLGTISGAWGVRDRGSVTNAVTNAGTISGNSIYGSTGVYLSGGGTVTNQRGAGIWAVGSSAATYGVVLSGGGTVDNQANATISATSPSPGISTVGVKITNGAGRVTNAGAISGLIGVALQTGTVTNESGGTITSSSYLGVSFAAGGGGGVINNQSGGKISGGTGVALDGGGSVTNAGSIVGLFGAAVSIGGGGSVNNQSGGTINGETSGVNLVNGGTVDNQNGGTISGGFAGVYAGHGAGTVTNAGSITGAISGVGGVDLSSGGTVNNNSGGTISGPGVGVYITGGLGSVTNAGTISGGTASVGFRGAGANTLTLQTGSVLTSEAFGSTAVGATNALILQGQGTANNNFVNFNTLNAQASGIWTLGGSSTFNDATVSSGTLSVTGALTSVTLEIAAGAEFDDYGAVTVAGDVTNAGNLTISGVTMTVGGAYNQSSGATTTLLNGGTLDPTAVEIKGGVFGGSGGVVGDVAVTGGEVKAGAGPGGTLRIVGDYSQTAGEIDFEIDPNGHGGFLETTLWLDPGSGIGISDTTFVFDFLNGANAIQFVADGLLNLNTFLLTGGDLFCEELDCATVLQDISFADNAGLRITGYDPTSGAMSTAAVPEPGTWALLATGFLGLGGLGLRRRAL